MVRIRTTLPGDRFLPGRVRPGPIADQLFRTGDSMVMSSGDISSLIYKRKVRDDLGDFSLDGQTLIVLMELDGKTALGALAAKTGLTMGALRQIITYLLKLGLIDRVEKRIVPVDNQFFRHLLDELALAIGPIAGVLIEDEVQDLGYDVNSFPSYLVSELVDRLAGEIRREDKKTVFLKSMVNIIRAKGYAKA
jgi:hypothetical protein